MVRVAFPFVGDTIGGSHISSLLLMKHLAIEGFEPTAIVHTDGVLVPWLEQHAATVLRVDLPFVSAQERGLSDVPALIWDAAKLAHFLRGNDFSIVHANDGRMITSWMPAGRLAGCKTVAHRRTRWSVSRLSDIAFSFAQRVIAISQYVEQTLPERLRRKSVVIANPFESDCMSRADARKRVVDLVHGEAPIITFIGTLQKQKRPDIFLRAAEIIHAQRPHARFLLIGRAGDQGRETRALCGELGLDHVVTFAGFRADAAQCLAGCDLLLAPAVEEGHGRTLVEAMTAGVPIVAAASGGHLEIIDQDRTGRLVAPDDPQALAQAALALLADPARASALSNAARVSAANKFSVAAHAKAVAGVYRSLLGTA